MNPGKPSTDLAIQPTKPRVSFSAANNQQTYYQQTYG